MSRWDSSETADSIVPPISFAQSQSTALDSVDKTKEKQDDEDEDPLDAFMSSLYESGEVAGQQELKNSYLASSLHSKSTSSANNASLNKVNSNVNIALGVLAKKDDEEEEENIEDALDLNGSFASLSSRQSSKLPGNNNSNSASSVITLEEIMQGLNQKRERRGWESDVIDSGVNSPTNNYNHNNNNGALLASTKEETEAEKEAREEKERQEFIEAFRKARDEEEKALQRLQKIDAEQEELLQHMDKKDGQTNNMNKNKLKSEDNLGRVFAEDQDIDLVDEYQDQQQRKSALELLEEAKKGKVLKAIDHSKITYLPFRKNLYIVPRQLAKLTPAEVQNKREDLQIKVHGNGCPPPVETWEQCGLSDRILQCLYQLYETQNDHHKLSKPFPIQQQAIPAIMCGRDVIGVAKTGSGKTLAFLLPMFRHILDQPPLQEGDGPIGLIMAPARELAFQIFNQAKKFCRVLGLRTACIYGGAGVAEQIADLKRGSEIVVCTPGRMIDILCMQAGKLVSLKRVTMVVMDEADRMFDMGFEPQIRMILQNIRPDRQTVLFSATFPKSIEKLAKSILRLPLEIIVGERSTVNKDITQYVEVHEEDDKFLRLLQLLGIYYEQGSILIFVDKQEKCDQLFQELLRAGYPCLSLHGGKDQVDRDHTLHEFKTGVKTVMVATSVAGRGLDVPEIVCVINYHCPNHLEDYVHRVGRTGRAGRKGVAYTFVSPSKEEQYAPIMVKALLKAHQNDVSQVPTELMQLAESFKAKVARGEAQWSSSGFVGKGFTFDGNELNEAQKAALLQKKQYALEQGIIKEEDLLLMDAMDDDAVLFGGVLDEDKDTSANIAVNVSNNSYNSSNNNNNNNVAVSSSSGASAVDTQSALAKARVIAQQLLLNKQSVSQSSSVSSAQSVASGAATSQGEYFAEELEINDYPIQARRKVTNKNALDDITEKTGVAVISRGSFVPAGKNPEPGEKKLFLLIEGRSELSVRQAKLDIQRALEEETLRIAGATQAGGGGGGMGGGGRYSVV